jgi:hypothetical protein
MERQIDLNGTEVEDIVVGTGVRFERIRRITGYLVGTLDRFNDAKRAEERDRVKHTSFVSAQGK